MLKENKLKENTEAQNLNVANRVPELRF